MTGPELNAVVIQRIDVSSGLMILKIAPDGWRPDEFYPGQYAMIGLPATAPRIQSAKPDPLLPGKNIFLQRSYSVASIPDRLDYLEFYITLVPTGALSPRLFALNVGDRIWMSKNFSGFFSLLRVPEDANIALVATGTGLSPCMCILRSHLRSVPDRKFALIYGARRSSELGYRSELISMDRLHSSFTYIETISRPADEPVQWTGNTGYVQDIWNGGAIADAFGSEPNPENTHVFVSGNPSMCDAMSGILLDCGYREQTFKKPGELHLERFW
jgi:ferredoxin--NADP+ reductase